MLTSNAFEDTRKPGDIDLVVEISNILALQNHPNPIKWTYDDIIQEAIGAAPKLQRFLINRYWRVQLGLCSVSTTHERFCLIDTGSYEDYLKIFRNVIAPTIVKLRLSI